MVILEEDPKKTIIQANEDDYDEEEVEDQESFMEEEDRSPRTLEETNPLSKDCLPLLPLKNVVILPKSIVPIIAGRDISIKAIEHALRNDRTVFITSQKDSQIENPKREDLFEYGTKSTILQVMRLPNKALKVLAEGICRAKIETFQQKDGFIHVTHSTLSSSMPDNSAEIEALWRELCSFYNSYAQYNEKAPVDLISMIKMAKTDKDIDCITDTIAMHIPTLSCEERQEILECVNLKERMIYLCSILKRETEILKAERKIRGRIQTQVEKNQREYYLTEQMKAIQKELGKEDQDNEIDKLKKQAQSAKLSSEAYEKVTKEIRRLEQMPPLSSEAAVSRNYIDWVVSLPWQKIDKDSISLLQAARILDKNHAELKKLKDRIVEFLAARKYSKNMKRAPIICFSGPPGVGKTSLARSIADSLGRKFVGISLGGIRDEAEIRGHRRTYIGALPGKIIQAMKKSDTCNPVILLDEIDKMSCDMHGDPSAALLEVLDPEQNKNFVDHFLDVEYDLSQVMFIATANILDNIPYPLYDRLEIISLSGYTKEEKVRIAQKFLVPKNLKEHSLTKRQCKISDEILSLIVEEYTKEAGVRQLERIITKIMRKTIQMLLEQSSKKSVTVTPELLKQWVGSSFFKKTSLNKSSDRTGLAVGLAYTDTGGDVLEIETSALSGKGGLTLTGQLGEVMQESAQAALSYIRSRAQKLGLRSSFHSNKDIHIHMPEGAVPKDGPSAGIAICTALISTLIKKPLLSDIAMTGEITLQGRVLAIGGLKEKILAAKQYGIKTVIVPQENADTMEEIEAEIDIKDLNIVFVSNMDEVLDTAFENLTATTKKTAKKGTTVARKTARKPKQVTL